MATKKDFTINENIDRGNSVKTENDNPMAGNESDAGKKDVGETDVKNAHAAGDGAYGRNEAHSFIDDADEAGEKKDEPAY